eukprot:8327096-Pyramimonas_sp.AAC.1
MSQVTHCTTVVTSQCTVLAPPTLASTARRSRSAMNSSTSSRRQRRSPRACFESRWRLAPSTSTWCPRIRLLRTPAVTSRRVSGNPSSWSSA